MITNVSGSFSKFNAEVSSEDETFAKADIVFSADIDSISTNNEQRDGHLKSPDFFDAANHPQIIIKVSFNVDFGGVAKDPWGNTKAGLTLAGTINRKDFGLNWNAPTEAGGLLVSEDVRLHAEIQLVKQA